MHAAKRKPPSSARFVSMWSVGLGLGLGLLASCGFEGPAAETDEAGDADAAEGLGDAICTEGTWRCHARMVNGRAYGFRSHAAAPVGYVPADLQAAYKIDPKRTATPAPLVAIVDAYGYPALESDLANYRAQFGLPPCTIASGCLKIVNQQGQTSPLPRSPPPNDDWTVETALDVDMVSALCPLCRILVVQAMNNRGEGMLASQNTAVRLGAVVISNSWGNPEQAGAPPEQVALTESFFDHPGVAIFVSAGDDGYNDAGAGPDYPGTSAHTIAVGGTRLVRAPMSPRGWSETAWTSGGSACSLSIPKPAYQTESPCPRRASADIAAVGDPQTGVAVYNAAHDGWITLGGTSASAPIVAAIYAATGIHAQSSGAFLAANTDKLFDVTSGSNGTCGTDTLLCNAAVGWDGPTGYGTPNGAALLPGSGGPEEEHKDEEVGGGCAAGGGAGVGLLLALAGLRRRRPASRPS